MQCLLARQIELEGAMQNSCQACIRLTPYYFSTRACCLLAVLMQSQGSTDPDAVSYPVRQCFAQSDCAHTLKT